MADPINDMLNWTIQNYRPILLDNLFNAAVLLAWLKDHGRVRGRVMGGKQINENILKSANTTFQWGGPFQTVKAYPEEHSTIATYDWKIFSGSVTVDDFSVDLNRSNKFQILNVIKTKVMSGEMSLADRLNKDLHGLNNADSTMVLGLQDLVSTTVKVGGLDPATETYWKAYEENTTEALTLTRLNEGYLKTSQPHATLATGSPGHIAAEAGLAVFPSLGLTTDALWLVYHSRLQPLQRINGLRHVGAQGFPALEHFKSVVLWDARVPANTWYYLNDKFIELAVAKEKPMTFGPFEKIQLQPVRVSEFYAYMELITTDRRYLGKLTNKS